MRLTCAQRLRRVLALSGSLSAAIAWASLAHAVDVVGGQAPAAPQNATTFENRDVSPDALAPLPPTKSTLPAEAAIPLEVVAPELRRIQQDLGGPVINQFPSLQPGGLNPTPLHPVGPLESTIVPPSDLDADAAIVALREAAAELDESANRLERCELYRQADALRGQAQRLRKDARLLPRPQRAGAESSVAPAWEPLPAPPYQPPQPPRRFGWELQSNPVPAEPDDRQIPRDPEIGQRQKDEADRG